MVHYTKNIFLRQGGLRQFQSYPSLQIMFKCVSLQYNIGSCSTIVDVDAFFFFFDGALCPFLLIGNEVHAKET